MSALEREGIVVAVPRGWEAEIYRRSPAPSAAPTVAAFSPEAAEAEAVLRYPPILHLATFPLPPVRGDYGGGVLAGMASTDAFIAIVDYGAEAADTVLFAHDPPWPLGPDDFDPNTLRVGIAGQSGCQKFFRAAGRGFCLYVVGSHALRRLSIASVNSALTGVAFR